MTRTERIHQIVHILETSRQAVPVRRFLDELEVSRATFKRDLDYLRDRLGAPIAWQPGACPLICNLTGEALPASEAPGGHYWRRQLRDAAQLRTTGHASLPGTLAGANDPDPPDPRHLRANALRPYVNIAYSRAGFHSSTEHGYGSKSRTGIRNISGRRPVVAPPMGRPQALIVRVCTHLFAERPDYIDNKKTIAHSARKV